MENFKATAYKVVERNFRTKRQKKKRVYTSYEDFEKYSPEVIQRYARCSGVAETYMLVGKEWVLMDIVKGDGLSVRT